MDMRYHIWANDMSCTYARLDTVVCAFTLDDAFLNKKSGSCVQIPQSALPLPMLAYGTSERYTVHVLATRRDARELAHSQQASLRRCLRGRCVVEVEECGGH